MTDIGTRKLRLAQLMRSVRRRVARRMTPAQSVLPPVPAASDPVPTAALGIRLPRALHHTQIERKNHYLLREFLEHQDSSFVRNAYIGLLGREPEESGWSHHLSVLRAGSRRKIEILGRIRYSREGRNRGVRVSGLLLRVIVGYVYRVPILGYFVRLPVALLRLPGTALDTARLEAYTNSRIADLESAVDRALSAAEAILQQLDQSQSSTRLHGDQLGIQLSEQVGRLEQVQADSVEVLGNRFDALARESVERQSYNKLALQVHELADSTPRRPAFEDLVRRVEEASRNSIDRESHESLRRELATLVEGSARREVVEDLSRRVDEASHNSIDRESHESLRRELATLVEGSARSEVVEDLARRVDEASRNSIDRESHDRLSQELATLVEGSARREVVEDLSRRVDEALRQSVHRDSFERLAQELSDLARSRVSHDDLDATMRGLADSLQHKADRHDLSVASLELQREIDALLKGQDERIESSLRAVRAQIGILDATTRAQRLSILEEERKHDVLLAETRQRLPKKLDASQLNAVVSDESHARDAMYAQFEDRFRGTREEIKERLREYLPYAAAAVQATRNAPLLDLGCGRGEWLELAGGEGWKARGVDSNRTMIQRCVDQDLEVEEADALEFLRVQKKNSFSVVVGIHMLEHIPFSEMVSVLDESLRVLRPGGIVIFETPNPENLMVGACNFYADPTHRNPIFPPTLEFLLKERGFEDVERLRVERGSDLEAFQPLSVNDPLASRLNPILAVLRAGFSAAPDFAVIGRKG